MSDPTDTLRAAGLHKTSDRIIQQDSTIAMLRLALRLIAEHPVEKSGEWEVAAREMQKVARMALGREP